MSIVIEDLGRNRDSKAFEPFCIELVKLSFRLDKDGLIERK